MDNLYVFSGGYKKVFKKNREYYLILKGCTPLPEGENIEFMNKNP